MPKQHLDPGLLGKLKKASGGKSLQYIREQISKKAGRAGISSLAAQIVWAQAKGIGVTHALNKASAEVRGEVRSAQSGGGVARNVKAAAAMPPRRRVGKPHSISAATIADLLQDPQLRGRCKDLLLAKKHFDRVFREATTVLDDRLKTKSSIKNLNPVNLVGKALNPDPKKAVIEVSSAADEQQGFHSICQGVMLAFRNKAHHSLSDKFTREDALKFCGFIDAILGTIEQAQIHLDRV
jgi:hypothetical protein